MKRLRLPRVRVDCLAIPDSVEFLSGLFETFGGHGPLLQFGRASRLMEIKFDPRVCDPYVSKSEWRNQIFVCLPEEVLRRFRIRLEDLSWVAEEH
jgi:hypothetical protein